MKKLIFILIICITLFSCKKEDVKKTYSLTFSANHWVSQENQFCDPYAYYSWSIEDENSNSKFDKGGIIKRTTISGTSTAVSGDWIFIYISVNDVFDNGSVSCKSGDGSVFLFASTDNLYINESEDITLKKININGRDTTIEVKQFKSQLK